MACRSEGDGVYISGYTAYECYTDEFVKYGFGIGLPNIIFWAIIGPGILIRIMHNN